MRALTLVLASLTAHALAHSGPPSARRKTLGFGPDLAHSRFEPVEVHASTSASIDITKDAYVVANEFLTQYDDPEAGRTYVVRPDSYTDHATGVTHVYARQIIGGIEVANGHVNLNIKDGRVLSVGDSFFPGDVERGLAHTRAQQCAQWSSALNAYNSLLRTPLGPGGLVRLTHELDVLEHLYDESCGAHRSPISSLAGASEVGMDPRRPLLVFLASALPESHPEFSLLQKNLEAYMGNIVMTPETYLLGEYTSRGTSLSNVPGAVSDVKARIVWMQVPTEHGIKLELAHRFEVEMEHNWYETTVTTAIPHRIISVVDWVRDSPTPMPVVGEVDQLPNFGAFVPPGPMFDSVTSVQGRERYQDKSLAGTKDVPYPTKLGKASYLVFPWGTNDPVEAALKKAAKHGESARPYYSLSYGREIMEELGDTYASPAGWHTLPISHDPSINDKDKATLGHSYWHTTNTTWGNNVLAQENWGDKNTWVYHSRPLVTDGAFIYPYSPRPADTKFDSVEEAKTYINASLTQLFYTSNMVHDLFYRYGFTEAAGNFQQYNFGRGGKEGDAIIAHGQDGDGFNNAAFTTPPDGMNGRCRMFLWDTSSPYPDGDMEAGIVIHELSHGLSTRLTGGPMNSGCLGWLESGGMGEGWGDFIASSVRSTSTYSDYAMGVWSSNRKDGVRDFPYSTNYSVNPTTYETLNQLRFLGIHQMGEVWAEMLWVTQQRLITKHGFSDTLLPPALNADGTLPPNDFYRPQTFNRLTGSPHPLVPKHGNTLMLQLVVTGMKIQPCNPSFFNARDAIIEADKVLTGGENLCDIWEGFAERGLGVDAEAIRGTLPWDRIVHKNGFKIPGDCPSSELKPVSPPTSERTR